MTYRTDVAIIGGGLGGSTAAAMLGRAGISATLVDPRPVYPPDFRCEKLDAIQAGILRKTGLAGPVLRACGHDGETWIARLGLVLDRRPSDQFGIMYDALVNTIRREIPDNVAFLQAKAVAIDNGSERRTVTLSNGETISARLVVLANGLNMGLLEEIGMRREILSAKHSTTAGFDIKPVGRSEFAFRSLNYYCERPSDRMAFLTLFPTATAMRANLFGYRDLHDPWFQELRARPVETLCALMPKLRNIIGDFEVTDFVQVRPVDLYATRGVRQPGIVLVGDAFSTSCPAAGTGARKALNDVERLCNGHIPQWLATPGMSADKIAAFYEDPQKRSLDDFSLAKAFDLRSLCIDTRLPWAARRWIRFASLAGLGVLRNAGVLARRRSSRVVRNERRKFPRGNGIRTPEAV